MSYEMTGHESSGVTPSQNMNELTWKDIPWADPSKAQLPVSEGTGAVVPELDDAGEKTGNFVALGHEEYMRIMGSLAYVKERSDGNPDRFLQKISPEEFLASSRTTYPPKAPLPTGGMKK